MKHSAQPKVERPLSPARQTWLMLVVIAPMAACYPAIKAGLEFAPSLRFGGLRTLVGGLALLIVLVIRRKPLWPEARLIRWILPLGLVATTLTFGAMFASPAYTGAGIASVLGNTQPLIIMALAGTALSTWLWFWLLQRTEAGRLSLYLFLVPVFGLLIAMSGFGERLNALQWGGVALILLAVALSVFAGRSGPVRRSNQPGGRPSSEPQRPENHRSWIDLGGVPTATVGPPTTGSHVLNELWKDALGGWWRCTARGRRGRGSRSCQRLWRSIRRAGRCRSVTWS